MRTTNAQMGGMSAIAMLPVSNAAIGSDGHAIMQYVQAQDDRFANLVQTLYRNSMWVTHIPGDMVNVAPARPEQNVQLAERLKSLREEFSPQTAIDRPSPRYVMYAASGYDAATVTSIFPEASAYILINNRAAVDIHPQSHELSPRVFAVPDVDFDGGWIRYRDGSTNVVQTGAVQTSAEAHGGMLSLILANMQVAHPDLALAGIDVFCGAPTPAYKADRSMRSHAIAAAIYYRAAQDDPMRALVYIYTDVNPDHADITIDRLDASDSQRKATLDFSFIDGLLIKGSQGVLDPLRSGPYSKAYSTPDVEKLRVHRSRDTLLGHVARNGGVVIEGQHAHPFNSEPLDPIWSWECFPDELRLCPERDPKLSWRMLYESRSLLSYTTAARVWRAIQGHAVARQARTGDDAVDEQVFASAMAYLLSQRAAMVKSPFVPPHLDTEEGLAARADVFRR